MWICPKKNDCRFYCDMDDKADDYCNGVKPYDPHCDRFEPNTEHRGGGGDGREHPEYWYIEQANPGYLVFFVGPDGWYHAFGRTAVTLRREFGYRENSSGGAGVNKRNWESVKRKYLAKGYGVILMNRNKREEKIDPPKEEKILEEVERPDEDGTCPRCGNTLVARYDENGRCFFRCCQLKCGYTYRPGKQ